MRGSGVDVCYSSHTHKTFLSEGEATWVEEHLINFCKDNQLASGKSFGFPPVLRHLVNRHRALPLLLGNQGLEVYLELKQTAGQCGEGKDVFPFPAVATHVGPWAEFALQRAVTAASAGTLCRRAVAGFHGRS